MRLLNTATLRLELFEGGPKLSYAILSHTWGDDEVSYGDLVAPGNAAESRAAWPKIASCCARARAEGYAYVWIDTCCIDKSSSAELSEAINSMFKWYQQAEVCYAYLADVDVDVEDASSPLLTSGAETFTTVASALEKSRWFTRGWTLQELLAPPDVVFYSARWTELGTRDTLAPLIARGTRIDLAVLQGSRGIASLSVAQRLSWAARRQTSRVEDEAYCLMGLFGVSMPLLYGEGRRAFKRLQLEIMRECYDPSILAWASVDSCASLVGVIASSPADFEGCGTIEFDGGGLHGGDYGSARACHDIIGSSLRKEAPVVALGDRGDDDIRLRPYDEDTTTTTTEEAEGDDDNNNNNPLHNLIHFPKESSHTVHRDFFEFSFLRHRGCSLILALLGGCREGGRGTVGITLCKDSSGLLKRVHYPTRFLLPDSRPDSGSSIPPPFRLQTLHISLSGTEVLQKPLVPAWTRCLVRITTDPPPFSSSSSSSPSGSDNPRPPSPYSISHTIPPTAPDAENCWYLNRWSEAVDRVTMTRQPCFSLHRVRARRAIVFRHAADPDRLSFRLVFSMWAKQPQSPQTAAETGAARRPLNLCVEAEEGGRVLEERDEADLLDLDLDTDTGDGIPDKKMPEPRRRFVVGEGKYEVVVKFRQTQQAYTLAIVQIEELGRVT